MKKIEDIKKTIFRRIRFSGIGVCTDLGPCRSSDICSNAKSFYKHRQLDGNTGRRGRRYDGSNRRQLISQKASSAIEFAFIAPILLALILWVASLGFHMYSQNIVSSAAREAARYAAIHGLSDMAPVYTEAGRMLDLVLPPNQSFVPNADTVTVEDEEGIITVKIVYDYDPLINYDSILNMLGKNTTKEITIHGVSYFKKEYP